jgi:hypothetical protein
MYGGRRRRRGWQYFGVSALLLVLAAMTYSVWAIRHGTWKATDLVTLVGLPISAGSLAAAILALRKEAGNEADLAMSWARTLARKVTEEEGLVRCQLLGKDFQRINLRYRLQPAPARAAEAPRAGRLFDASPAAAPRRTPRPSLPAITNYYRDTKPARLVITGAAGSGKTVLALELLLGLLKVRSDTDPVPIRVPLAQWDACMPLRTLLIKRLDDTYGCPAVQAGTLVDQGLILPVLDGLDEMDPTLPDGTPDPDAPRARAALDRLNEYPGPDGLGAGPVILTCRTDHYVALPRTEALLDAALVTIDPVDTRTAANYLAAQTVGDPQRWQPLLRQLTAHPTGPHGELLSTPWRLCLVATAYRNAGDPTDLLRHATQADLDSDLLGRYITAVAKNIENRHGYTPGQIHRWLHHLTSRLATPHNPAARTDLALHDLWPLAGRVRVGATDALLSAALVSLPALPFALHTGEPALFTTLIAALAIGTGLAHAVPPLPRRLRLRRLPTARGLQDFTFSLAGGVLFGLLGGFGIKYLLQATGAPEVCLTAGLAFGIARGVTDAMAGEMEPRDAATPRTVIGEAAACCLVGALAAGLAGGLAGASLDGLPGGLATGIAAAVAAGLGGGEARRYIVFLMCSHRRLPFRLARFLDWSCKAGLLRHSGPAYQFRHRELQRWLTENPTPVP